MPHTAGAHTKIRVLLVDDHLVVRRGLRTMLGEAADIEVVADVGSASEALSALHSDPIDVVISDITLPGLTGLELLKTIKAEQPKLPVLIMSMHAEEMFAVRALKLGAAAYLTKDAHPEAILTAVRKAAGGGKYITPTVAEKLANEIEGGSGRAPHERLSEREFEVFRLIASGTSLTAIAEKLQLSAKTVTSYRARVLQKTGFQSNAELTRYAVERGLLE